MAVLAACTFAFGPLKMFNLYFMPYWINVIWLDVVTYLHHHGSEDPEEKLPWYRGKVGMGCLLEDSSLLKDSSRAGPQLPCWTTAPVLDHSSRAGARLSTPQGLQGLFW